jgi:hypothetical protein
MKNTQINRVIGLVRKTGDRVVVMDQETEEVLVMMRLDEYENLMDFALPGGGDGPEPEYEAWDDVELPDDTMDETEPVVASQQKTPEPDAPEKKLDFSEDWTEKTDSNGTEEDLSDVPADEEEPRFYLEPVE